MAGPAAAGVQIGGQARRALWATAVFKVGMEALAVTAPLIALTYFGSALWMATMVAAWGASMTMASMLAGGLLDRKPVNKVMAGAMAVQAAAVAVMAALLFSGIATPLAILPLHAAAGAAMGVITAGRDTLPARLLGRDHAVLGAFNARAHLFYEVSGTVAPLLAGLLIKTFGVAAGLLLHPPAYLLAAWLFSRMRLPVQAAASQAVETGADGRDPGTGGAGAEAAPRRKGLAAALSRAVSDIREGARIILGSREFRWLGLMVLGPMVVHRAVEQMMIPVFAKSVLGMAEKAAWFVSSSNFGELLGAMLLLRALTQPDKNTSPFRWVRAMALGTLAVWALAFQTPVALALALVLAMSLSWAANDINLTSYLQSRLPDASAGKAVGFLMAAEFALIMAASYGMGFLFDLLPMRAAFVVINIGLTAAAYVFWKGRRALQGRPPPSSPPSPASRPHE